MRSIDRFNSEDAMREWLLNHSFRIVKNPINGREIKSYYTIYDKRTVRAALMYLTPEQIAELSIFGGVTRYFKEKSTPPELWEKILALKKVK